MDPLSISCMILASIHAARRTIEFIRTIRNAPREAEDLKQELAVLEEAVNDVAQTLRESPDDTCTRNGKVILGPLKAIWQDVENLNVYLGKKFKHNQVSAFERFSWSKERPHIKEFNDLLNRRKLNLLLAISAAGISAAFRVDASMRRMSATLPVPTTTTQTVTVTIDQRLSTDIPPAKISTDAMSTGCDPLLRQTSFGSGSEIIGPAPPYTSVVSLSTKYPSPNKVITCSCRCHSRRCSRSPAWMQGFAGEFYYTRAQIGACSNATCRSQCFRRAISTACTWRPPAWSQIQRAIAFSIETTFFTNPKYSLTFPRQVGGGAKIFHCAVTGNVDGLRALIQSGMASPDDQKWNSGSTALHYAVLSGRIEVCEFLINAGCNPCLPTTASITATDYALTQVLGRREMDAKARALRVIFKLSDVIEDHDYSLLHEIVLGLRSDQTLECALLDNPHTINATDATGRTALSWAVQRGDKTSTKLLLEFHADPNIADVANMTPLHYSTYAEDEECLEMLISHHVHISPRDDDRGWMPIHYAAYFEDKVRMVDILLNHGGDPDAQTTSDKSVLVLAVLKNHSACVARLLQSNANTDLADNSGWVPLNYAIASRSIASLELLVAAGMDLSQLCWGTENVLHLLATYPDLEAMHCVRAGNLAGVSIEALNKDGKTAGIILREQNVDADVQNAFYEVIRKAISDNQLLKEPPVMDYVIELRDVEKMC